MSIQLECVLYFGRRVIIAMQLQRAVHQTSNIKHGVTQEYITSIIILLRDITFFGFLQDPMTVRRTHTALRLRAKANERLPNNNYSVDYQLPKL